MPPPPNAKAPVPIDGVMGLFEHRIEGAAMPPPPNAKAPVPIDGVMGLFEHRIEGAERSAAHHGAAHNQEVGASGGPHESVIAVVGGSAVAVGQDTVTIGLVQNSAEDRGDYSIMVGDANFEASAHAPEAGGADAAANTFMTLSDADFIIKFESSEGRARQRCVGQFGT